MAEKRIEHEEALKKNFENVFPESSKNISRGLKNFFHGNLYQVKLSLRYGLYLYMEELNQDSNYIMTTEIAGGGKLDDLVVITQDKHNKINIFFLQAKHTQSGSKNITPADLLKSSSVKDNAFSIEKYFISYQSIKRNLELSNYQLESCYLCTNYGLTSKAKELTIPFFTGNPFFYHESGKLFKLNPQQIQLQTTLKKAEMFTRLVNKLATHAKNGTEMRDYDEIYQFYHVVLLDKKNKILIPAGSKKMKRRNKTVDVPTIKFHPDFIAGINLQEEDVQQLRKEFFEEYCGGILSEEAAQKSLKDKEFTHSPDFGIPFEWEYVDNCEMLAKDIYKRIKSAKDVSNISYTDSCYSTLLQQLAGYVFVSAERKKTLRFSNYFFGNSFAVDVTEETTKTNLLNFKKVLRNQLKDNDEGLKKNSDMLDLKFREFAKCRFDFGKTYLSCYEYLTSLSPNTNITDKDKTDYSNFFKNFVLAVNQPGESRLSEIICKKLGESFNLCDATFVADYMVVKSIDWIKVSNRDYLTNSGIGKFFEEAKQKIATLSLIAPTQYYCKQLMQFGNCQISEKLQKFLSRKSRKRILWLCNNNPVSIATTVEQTLLDTNTTFQRDDSFIFNSLLFFATMNEKTLLALKSTSNNMIIVVENNDEDEIGEENLSIFAEDLLQIIKVNKRKKLVIVAKNDSKFAQTFKIHRTNVVFEIKKTNLSNKKIIFQGKFITVLDLLGLNHSLNSELLSKLLSFEKIKIGKAIIPCKASIQISHNHTYDKIVIYPIKNRKNLAEIMKEIAAKKKSDHPALWIAQAKLKDILRQRSVNPSSSFKEIFYSILENEFTSVYDKEIFGYLHDNEKTIIIIDGYKQVSPKKKDKVVKLLENLEKSFREILFITSSNSVPIIRRRRLYQWRRSSLMQKSKHRLLPPQS